MGLVVFRIIYCTLINLRQFDEIIFFGTVKIENQVHKHATVQPNTRIFKHEHASFKMEGCQINIRVILYYFIVSVRIQTYFNSLKHTFEIIMFLMNFSEIIITRQILSVSRDWRKLLNCSEPLQRIVIYLAKIHFPQEFPFTPTIHITITDNIRYAWRLFLSIFPLNVGCLWLLCMHFGSATVKRFPFSFTFFVKTHMQKCISSDKHQANHFNCRFEATKEKWEVCCEFLSLKSSLLAAQPLLNCHFS